MFSNDHSLNHLVLVRSLSCDHVYKTSRFECGAFSTINFSTRAIHRRRNFETRDFGSLCLLLMKICRSIIQHETRVLFFFFFLVRFFVTRRCFTREREKKELKREIGNLLFKGRGNVKIECFRDFKKCFFFSRILFSFFLLSMKFVATFLRFLMYCIFF